MNFYSSPMYNIILYISFSRHKLRLKVAGYTVYTILYVYDMHTYYFLKKFKKKKIFF